MSFTVFLCRKHDTNNKKFVDIKDHGNMNTCTLVYTFCAISSHPIQLFYLGFLGGKNTINWKVGLKIPCIFGQETDLFCCFFFFVLLVSKYTSSSCGTSRHWFKWQRPGVYNRRRFSWLKTRILEGLLSWLVWIRDHAPPGREISQVGAPSSTSPPPPPQHTTHLHTGVNVRHAAVTAHISQTCLVSALVRCRSVQVRRWARYLRQKKDGERWVGRWWWWQVGGENLHVVSGWGRVTLRLHHGFARSVTWPTLALCNMQPRATRVLPSWPRMCSCKSTSLSTLLHRKDRPWCRQD